MGRGHTGILRGGLKGLRVSIFLLHTHSPPHASQSLPYCSLLCTLNKRHKHHLLPLPHPIGTLLLCGQFLSGDSTAVPAGAVTIVLFSLLTTLPLPSAAGSCFPRTVLVARTINSNSKPTYRQMKSRCVKPAGSAHLGACDSSFRGRPLLQREGGWGWGHSSCPWKRAHPLPQL